MRLFAILAALVLVALLGPLLLTPGARPPASTDHGLPWQIETFADGRSRVFGLTLPTSTLEEAIARFGPEAEIALIVPAGRPPALEAYYPVVSLGFITGRLLLTVDAPPDDLASMAGRAVKREPQASGAWRLTLSGADLALARGFPLQAIGFIPNANLDEPTVVERFGPPQQRLRTSPEAEHLLYPARGLDLMLDTRGKELLQYVAPMHFERLRAPLGAVQ